MSWTLLSDQDITGAVATIEFVSVITSAHLHYALVLSDIEVDTNSDFMNLEVSQNNGSTWETGATDYEWIVEFVIDTGGPNRFQSTGDAHAQLINGTATNQMGTAAGEHLNGVIRFFDPENTSNFNTFQWRIAMVDEAAGRPNSEYGSGMFRKSGDLGFNAFRLTLGAGNFDAGNALFYGIS